MAMADYELKVSRVTKATTIITQCAEELLDAAKGMISSAEELTKFWEGGTSETFAAELKQADERYIQLCELVCVFVDSLNTTARWYADVEEMYAPNRAVKSK